MKKTAPKKKTSALRREAGTQQKTKTDRLPALSQEKGRRIVHVEPEIRNERLRRVQAEPETFRRNFADLYDFAPIGYFSFDKNGIILDVNLTGAIMLGMSKQLLIGKSFSRFIAHATGREEFFKHLAAVVKGQTKRTSELWLKGNDGVEFFAELQSIPAEGEQGATFVRATLADITERRRTEEALRESEEQFRSLFSQSPVAIELYDLDGRLIDANPSCLRMFGIRGTEEVKGFLLFEDPNVPADAKQRLRSGESVRFEAQFDFDVVVAKRLYETTRSGRCFIECYINRWNDASGELRGYLVFVSEITERKRAEERLRESEAQFRSFFESSAVGAAQIDLRGRFLLVNEQLCRITGYSRDELLNMSVADLTHPEDRSDLEVLSRYLRGDRSSYNVEKRYRRKDGGVAWVQISAALVHDAEGRPRYSTGVIQDITDRKQAEEALRESRQRYSLLFSKSAIAASLLKWSDKVFVDVNEAFETLFGYTRQEVIGRNPRDLGIIRPEEDEATVQAIEQQGEQRSAEIHALTKTGDERVLVINHDTLELEGEKYVLSTMLDITDRKRAEAALRQREEQLRLALSAGRLATWDWRFPNEVAWNDEHYRIMGYEPGEVQPSFQAWLARVHPDDQQPMETVFERVLKQGGDYAAQFRALLPGGAVRWIASSGHMALDEEGRPVRSYGVMQDITDRMRAEEALRASEARFRGLIEKAPVAINISRSGKTMYVNQKFLMLYGFQNNEELAGRSILDFWAPESRDMIRERSQKRLRGEQVSPEYEGTGQRRDESRFPVRVSVETIELPDGPAFMAVLTDITERKRAEDALRASEQRLALAASGTEIGMYDWDITTGKALCTEQIARLLGLPSSDAKMISMELTYRDWAERMHPEDLPRVEAELRRTMTDHEPFASEYRVVWPDQSVHWIAGRGIFSYDAQDRPERMLGILMDITDRKLAENLLMAATRDLQQRTHELAETNKELDAFSYSVSHDLRAPLRHIDGFAHALLDGYADKLDDRGKDYLRRVSSGAQKMKDLVDALLNLSRYTRANLNRTKVYLSSMVRTAGEERRHGWPDRAVELIVADGVTAEGDPTMLQVVINNLVWNAWKFTRDRPDARIEFGVTELSGERVYFIRDNGVGFNKEYGERLFIPFQRLHTNEEFPGTGIGLATVQRIIHRHGGRIWAEGEVGKGATFYFTLG